jgi:hypothetical protein
MNIERDSRGRFIKGNKEVPKFYFGKIAGASTSTNLLTGSK